MNPQSQTSTLTAILEARVFSPATISLACRSGRSCLWVTTRHPAAEVPGAQRIRASECDLPRGKEVPHGTLLSSSWRSGGSSCGQAMQYVRLLPRGRTCHSRPLRPLRSAARWGTQPVRATPLRNDRCAGEPGGANHLRRRRTCEGGFPFKPTIVSRREPTGDPSTGASATTTDGSELLHVTHATRAVLWRVNHRWRRSEQNGFTLDKKTGYWARRPDDDHAPDLETHDLLPGSDHSSGTLETFCCFSRRYQESKPPDR